MNEDLAQEAHDLITAYEIDLIGGSMIDSPSVRILAQKGLLRHVKDDEFGPSYTLANKGARIAGELYRKIHSVK